jgi:DNA-binding protein H-NS
MDQETISRQIADLTAQRAKVSNSILDLNVKLVSARHTEANHIKKAINNLEEEGKRIDNMLKHANNDLQSIINTANRTADDLELAKHGINSKAAMWEGLSDIAKSTASIVGNVTTGGISGDVGNLLTKKGTKKTMTPVQNTISTESKPTDKKDNSKLLMYGLGGLLLMKILKII